MINASISPSRPAIPSHYWKFIRRGFFASWPSGLFSIACVAFLAWLVWTVFQWAVLDATFAASAGIEECRASDGACWSVIANRWRLIFFGLYPYEQHWRSALACICVILTVGMSCLPAFWHTKRLAATWILGFVCFYILMKGGVLGLSLVREEQWGGLALTLFIFSAVSVIGMPAAIMLALLRNSEMPWIAKATGVLIDTVRSLPMLTIIFFFAIVLPFMMPGTAAGEKLYRVIAAFTLYFAVYQAEIIRGGMQGVGKGQDEAAKALGLPYHHRIARIVLPQAFRVALPATINQFVVSFMETSLVTVVGFFDLLASGNAAYRTGEWNFAFVEVYAFVGAIYFIFVFGLSRYGAYVERHLGKSADRSI